MTDPRLVTPQRVPSPSAAEPEACAHRYWCWKRTTAAVLVALFLVGLVAAVWWWSR